AHAAQLLGAFRRVRRKELNAEQARAAHRAGSSLPSTYGLSAAKIVRLIGADEPRAAYMRATAPHSHGASRRLPAARSFCIDECIVSGSVSRNCICAATNPSGSAMPWACASRIVSYIDV